MEATCQICNLNTVVLGTKTTNLKKQIQMHTSGKPTAGSAASRHLLMPEDFRDTYIITVRGFSLLISSGQDRGFGFFFFGLINLERGTERTGTNFFPKTLPR